jgi:hypothetical protein
LFTTRVFERDPLGVAAEMEKAFVESQAERGTEAASASERTAAQINRQ